MNTSDWKSHPDLKNISQEKLNLLTDIISQSNNMKANTLIPFFLSAASNAGKNGLSFSDSETDLIVNVLKTTMSPEEVKKIDTIRQLAQMISKKQANS